MSVSFHPSWSLAVEQGTLLLTPCPGTQGVELCESLSQLKAGGATAVITLMTADELHEEGLPDFSRAVKAAGLDWFHLPVPDFGVPGADFEQAWQACHLELQQRLRSGDTLALHCKGGSGRTGMVAARLMLAAGFAPEAAITAIQALRPRAFSYPAQRDYLLNSATL
ncbi:protein tyrosine phosphatase [Oceanimonas sp. GK1]|uniref:cyclin-dependent kinase inhibitor 3 family protein n=1 Tax=Oceanimonas sp. (strain GK1 / IBRC-M 10197) TaxID=511062 RepID=UPI0002494B35|nr:cyclin-dependent kinase inhibitor 3 family protein [Oceanimonas sp. GK1]AEY00215.1 protein tyrosine phosphatase [Oceanimonas sp. GK1]